VAALARLCLLRTHGGVWVDATVFCRRPLDEWLPEHAASGFFAFANPVWIG
jgi:mannosyltransferase OCH1-like enzyme